MDEVNKLATVHAEPGGAASGRNGNRVPVQSMVPRSYTEPEPDRILMQA